MGFIQASLPKLLDFGDVPVRVRYAGERHAGRVIEMQAGVRRPAARRRGVVQNPDGGVRSRDTDKDDLLSPEDFLQVEGVTVEADGPLHVSNGHDEEE